jgi:alpha-L-rhamnosidase
MIKEGATTIWERWEYLAGSGMNSHNHIMFGTVDTWFYRVLAGINVDCSAPGFEHFTIKPCIIGDLKNVSASIRTIKGAISSEWVKSQRFLTLKISVPVNSKAHVYCPKLQFEKVLVKESGEVIWKNSKYIKKIKGIKNGKDNDEYVVFEVGSGSYIFEISEE